MKIKTEYKGKEIYIDIPDSKYWEERNKKKVLKEWSKADNLEIELRKTYTKAYKELEKELYTFIGKSDTSSYSFKRVLLLISKLKPHIDILYKEQSKSIIEHLKGIFKNEYMQTVYMVQDNLKVYGNFVGINERAVKAAITYPWSGDSFSDKIYQSKEKLIATLREEIKHSIIRGDSIQELAKTVSNRLDIGYRASQRLVQTETGAIMTEADKLAYKEMDLDKYEYLSTLDGKTTEICKDLDGKVFETKDMQIGFNAPPMHYNCRSTTVPYFDDIVSNRIARRLDNNEVEYIPSGMSYREWEKKFNK